MWFAVPGLEDDAATGRAIDDDLDRMIQPQVSDSPFEVC